MALTRQSNSPIDATVLDWRSQWPLTLGFAVLLLIAAISAWLTVDNRRQNELVAHTLQVQKTASRFYIFMQAAETGQRGYLLAGQPEYDARHREGMAGAPVQYDALVRLTADNPEAREQLLALKGPFEAKLSELEQTMALARAGQTDAARAIMRTGYGRTLMRDILQRVERIVADEERLLAGRRQRAEANALALLVITLAGLTLVIGMAAISFRNVRRYTLAIESQRNTLRDLADNLEEMVRERTSDLTAANEEIQRYAYIVSHDLRAPLVNIMGFTAELDAVRSDIKAFRDQAVMLAPQLNASQASRAIDEDLPESIDFIRTSTQKMDRLINALLKISREGRRVLTSEPVDMTLLVQNAAKSVAHQLAETNAGVEVDPLPPIVGDRVAIEQIFGNLIENAVKYQAAGRPGEVRVSGTEKGHNVEFRIADNGRGIDPKDHERVFDLFRRAGTQDRPGEGIGLAHVRALVRRLGGAITVESALGEGSTFIVTLPRRLREEEAAS